MNDFYNTSLCLKILCVSYLHQMTSSKKKNSKNMKSEINTRDSPYEASRRAVK